MQVNTFIFLAHLSFCCILYRTPSITLSKDQENLDAVDDEDEESFEDEQMSLPLRKKGKQKRKPGRKAQWFESLFNNFVDRVVNNEYYKKRLIFMTVKNKKNAEIYEKILKDLKARANKRGENVPFTPAQLRTKFKKALSECKKVALTVKTATGIKR